MLDCHCDLQLRFKSVRDSLFIVHVANYQMVSTDIYYMCAFYESHLLFLPCSPLEWVVFFLLFSLPFSGVMSGWS